MDKKPRTIYIPPYLDIVNLRMKKAFFMEMASFFESMEDEETLDIYLEDNTKKDIYRDMKGIWNALQVATVED